MTTEVSNKENVASAANKSLVKTVGQKRNSPELTAEEVSHKKQMFEHVLKTQNQQLLLTLQNFDIEVEARTQAMRDQCDDMKRSLRNMVHTEMSAIPSKVRNMKMRDYLSNDAVPLPSTAKKLDYRNPAMTPLATPRFRANDYSETPLYKMSNPFKAQEESMTGMQSKLTQMSDELDAAAKEEQMKELLKMQAQLSAMMNALKK
ncbi:cell division cycle associated 8-like [Planoprotostelium fungivorum]|uniref:Cell division cycle associated 8-like n=1 Tax=Planoprotostelium fungivorum TaxID=1890364 RepID=A0A2P6NSS6_9EUKA|nr:cell division cycle associated 8-like [Planoprotostelium fungivorum]